MVAFQGRAKGWWYGTAGISPVLATLSLLLLLFINPVL